VPIFFGKSRGSGLPPSGSARDSVTATSSLGNRQAAAGAWALGKPGKVGFACDFPVLLAADPLAVKVTAGPFRNQKIGSKTRGGSRKFDSKNHPIIIGHFQCKCVMRGRSEGLDTHTPALNRWQKMCSPAQNRTAILTV
jgi:hypothetical protein